jgi:hypothetical protein
LRVQQRFHRLNVIRCYLNPRQSGRAVDHFSRDIHFRFLLSKGLKRADENARADPERGADTNEPSTRCRKFVHPQKLDEASRAEQLKLFAY